MRRIAAGALILVFVVLAALPCLAEQQLFVRKDEAGNEVMWRLVRDGRNLWEAHDIAARGKPDLLFFFERTGERYRRVLIDFDADGKADVVALFDSDGTHHTFYDCDGDGRFATACAGGMGELTEQYLDVLLRVNLRMALERRIESDRHPDVFWSTRPADPARGETPDGPISMGQGRTFYATIDLSWTPAAIGPDTDPKTRPLSISAPKIQFIEGYEAGTALRGLAMQTSLPDDPQAARPAELTVRTFAVPLDSPEGKRWMAEIDGEVRMPEFTGGFAFVTELAPDRPAFVTTPTVQPDGTHKDLLFFIVQLESETAP